MKNIEKYKTSRELVTAFWSQYNGPVAPFDAAVNAFDDWLDLKSEAEELLPYPSCRCGVACEEIEVPYSMFCLCGYSIPRRDREKVAIAEHNRMARSAIEAKEKETARE